MSSNKSNARVKAKKQVNTFTYLLIYFIGLAIGYYLLNYVATWEKPILGNTFYIVLGCTMIAVFSILILINLQKKFFPKRSRKSKSRHRVFLKDGPKRDASDGHDSESQSI